MNTVASTVSTLQLFGEPSRVRLLALLAHEELSVAELTAATRLAQSRVSTHLGKLREAGVLRDRRDGHSTYYSLNDGAMPHEAKRLWGAIQSGIKDAVLEGDRDRCAKVLRARSRGKGSAWAEPFAGEMERHYSPGRTWESLARGVLALGRFGDVLDVGCGDGAVAQLVAERAKSVTCIDRSEKMIAAAKKRLGRREGARCILGDAETLPFADESFDQVLLFNLLSCVESPAKVVKEAARVLRNGGEVAVSVVGSHAHAAVTAEYGHIHPGFSPAALRKLLAASGLTVSSCAITSREKRAPHFEVVTASASRNKD